MTFWLTFWNVWLREFYGRYENPTPLTDVRGLPEMNHYWLELPDGQVLDPTADQFNDEDGFEHLRPLPPVYIGKPLDIHRAALSEGGKP